MGPSRVRWEEKEILESDLGFRNGKIPLQLAKSQRSWHMVAVLLQLICGLRPAGPSRVGTRALGGGDPCTAGWRKQTRCFKGKSFRSEALCTSCGSV